MFEKTEYNNEEGFPILMDNNGKNITEGFYISPKGLAYVSIDDLNKWWVIQLYNQTPEESEFLRIDYAKNLERVKDSAGLEKKLKLQLKFLRRKAYELFS